MIVVRKIKMEDECASLHLEAADIFLEQTMKKRDLLQEALHQVGAATSDVSSSSMNGNCTSSGLIGTVNSDGTVTVTIPDRSPFDDATSTTIATLLSSSHHQQHVENNNNNNLELIEGHEQSAVVATEQAVDNHSAKYHHHHHHHVVPPNTRIVYRIIHPSELHRTTTIKPRKAWGRKDEESEGEEYVEELPLTVEEKEERKRHQLRTRCGRTSKPPGYMLKDYQHLHRLDFDDDDESGSGYADYQQPTSEDRQDRRLSHNYFAFDAAALKSKNFKCGCCDKAYIGKAGLLRHWRLHPDHGEVTNKVQEDKNNDVEIETVDDLGEFCRGRTDPSEPSNNNNRRPLDKASSGRRKSRLKALMRYCRDDELLEVAMPRLFKRISTWQFLLKKCETDQATRRYNLNSIQTELSAVVEQAEKLASNYLEECSDQLYDSRSFAVRIVTATTFAPSVSPTRFQVSGAFQVTDQRAARAMGLRTGGKYRVKQCQDVSGEDDVGGGTEDEVEEDEDEVVEEEEEEEDEEDEELDEDEDDDDILSKKRIRLDGNVLSSSPYPVDVLDAEDTGGWSLGGANDAELNEFVKTLCPAGGGCTLDTVEILDMFGHDSLSLSSSNHTPIL